MVSVFNKIALSLLILAAAIALFLSSEHFFTSSPKLSVEEQVKFLDRDIETLNAQLKKKRVEAFNAQMDAQELLPVQWEGYSKKIEEVEEHEKVIESLEKKIKDLSMKKQKLISPNPSPKEK